MADITIEVPPIYGWVLFLVVLQSIQTLFTAFIALGGSRKRYFTPDFML